MRLATSLYQRQEAHKILYDLIYAQDFFLQLLSKAIIRESIRCLQWSVDGKFVCVNKTQMLVEFEYYFNLISPQTLECYNRLISRLLEHNFQLATSHSELPGQVECYFHPNFNKATCIFYEPENELLQPYAASSSTNISYPGACSSAFFSLSNLAYKTIKRSYGSPLPTRELCNKGNQRMLTQSQRYRLLRPVNNFCLPTDSITSWNGVRAVPLSFFPQTLQPQPHSTNSSSKLECLNFNTIGKSTREYSEIEEEESSKTDEEATASSPISTADCKEQQKSYLTDSQKKIFNMFFDPKHRKTNFETSWIDKYDPKESREIDSWNSAVLMPTGENSKHKQAKSNRSKGCSVVQNNQLVDAFGQAYVHWRQHRDKSKTCETVKIDEDSGFARINYSSLYAANTSQNILKASRDECQIQAAVQSILI